jgi:hypothetical protein
MQMSTDQWLDDSGRTLRNDENGQKLKKYPYEKSFGLKDRPLELLQ